LKGKWQWLTVIITTVVIYFTVFMAENFFKYLRGVVVHPTDTLLNLTHGETVRASKLRMCTEREKNGHFFSESLPDSIMKVIRCRMESDLQRMMKKKTWNAKILEGGAQILKHKQRLTTGVPLNEAEVIYAVCNQLLGLVCDIFEYKVQLEDKIRTEEKGDGSSEPLLGDLLSSLLGGPEDIKEEELGHEELGEGSEEGSEEENVADITIGSKMAPFNRADYVVYKCVDLVGKLKMVVIIDAKTRIDVHAITQLIGYYSAAEVSESPPVVVVMSHMEIQFILFPFTYNSDSLINAIALTPILLWDPSDVEELDFSVIKLFLGVIKHGSNTQTYSVGIESDNIFRHSLAVSKHKMCDKFVSDKVKHEEMKEELKRQAEELKRQARLLKTKDAEMKQWRKKEKQEKIEVEKNRIEMEKNRIEMEKKMKDMASKITYLKSQQEQSCSDDVPSRRKKPSK
jgi:hypothetical protein